LALYFVGALSEGPTTIARVLAFAILFGFAAPKLWISQEKLVANLVEKRMRALIEEYSLLKPDTSTEE
jgi:Na+/H+-dicarboxylate symporter